MAAILLDKLAKSYRTGVISRRQVDAVRGVTLSVERQQVFGLLGPNGAGKTTIVKLILGLVSPTSGSAQVLGHNAGQRAARQRIGYLPEHHQLPGHLTGQQTLEYYGRLSGMSGREIRKRSPEVLEQVGMANWAVDKTRNYSKGMRQRLGLAQAMIHDPDLYILDEPTDGVDPVGRAEIRSILHDLAAKKRTVFVNSHLLQEVELLCDHVAILSQGQLRAVGQVRDITGESPRLRVTIDRDLAPLADALSPFDITPDPSPISPVDGWSFVVEDADSARRDLLVDTLRQAGCSIIEMTRLRKSLEDAFLDTINERQVGGHIEAASSKGSVKPVAAKLVDPKAP
jgi:ABC-2 type transport system ATP-binding protein